MKEVLNYHEVFPEKAIVSVGSLRDGYVFFGPFRDRNAAREWAAKNVKLGARWSTQPLFDVREGA